MTLITSSSCIAAESLEVKHGPSSIRKLLKIPNVLILRTRSVNAVPIPIAWYVDMFQVIID